MTDYSSFIFVSPEMAYRDIGEALYPEILKQMDKDVETSQKKQNRFKRVKSILMRFKTFFKRAEL